MSAKSAQRPSRDSKSSRLRVEIDHVAAWKRFRIILSHPGGSDYQELWLDESALPKLARTLADASASFLAWTARRGPERNSRCARRGYATGRSAPRRRRSSCSR